MASLFISHSSTDRDAAERVGERLRAEGFAALFLDFDPDRGIPAGREWERELYAQLRKTDAVVFLASAASAASRWCFAEVSLARSLSKPVFPLRVNGGTQLELLDDVQWVDLADGEVAFTKLWAGLRQAGLDPTGSFAWDPTRRPYPGLEPFALEDAAVFFGRDHEIDRLLELVQPTLQRGAGRLVAIVGPSGSGKSSLLRAGLLPRLKRLKERWVLVPPVLPGKQPTRNMARSLTQAFAERGCARTSAEIERQLASGPGALVELAGELAENSGEDPNVLVVIDQAEELLTRSGEREQQGFLRLLGGALAEDSPLWVMLTVRSEFLSTAPERAGLAEVVDDALMVEPLSRARLPEVIQRPAQRAGLDFEAGLVERMVEETTGGDALPLLAYTLQELWQRVGYQGTVRFADYEAVGGVVGALQRQADRLVDDLTRRGQGPQIMPTLLKLASVEGDEEPTRRRLRRGELTPEEQEVVDAFVDARLLTSSKSEGGGEADAVVEVAHEALLRQWEPLRRAIEEARSSLRRRSELERLAADWDQARRDHENEDAYLLVRGRLAEFRHWAGQHPGDLGPTEGEFLRASEAFEASEIRRWRRRSLILGAITLGLLISVVISLTALWQRNEAVEQAQLQSFRTLGEQVTSEIFSEVGAFSPDGRLFASDDRDEKTVLLYDVTSRKRVGEPLAGHDAAVLDVAFSPDGGYVASASEDGTMRVWDVESSELVGRFYMDSFTTAVAFSPDGEHVASASADTTVRLWDVSSGKEVNRFDHADVVTAVAFSPDGRLLASGSADGTVRLWDAESGDVLGDPLTGHTNAVDSVRFSPDGKYLASASTDMKVCIWNAATGEAVYNEAHYPGL